MRVLPAIAMQHFQKRHKYSQRVQCQGQVCIIVCQGHIRMPWHSHKTDRLYVNKSETSSCESETSTNQSQVSKTGRIRNCAGGWGVSRISLKLYPAQRFHAHCMCFSACLLGPGFPFANRICLVSKQSMEGSSRPVVVFESTHSLQRCSNVASSLIVPRRGVAKDGRHVFEVVLIHAREVCVRLVSL